MINDKGSSETSEAVPGLNITVGNLRSRFKFAW